MTAPTDRVNASVAGRYRIEREKGGTLGDRLEGRPAASLERLGAVDTTPLDGNQRFRRVGSTAALAAVVILAACGSPPPPAPLPPNAFAFGVFGDGAYRWWEEGRYRRVLADAGAADIRWFLHVGDLFWYPCSDAQLDSRLAGLNAMRHPVVYTPGDNEWTDCHEPVAGRFQPLERLQRIRSTFFARPDSSLGARRMPLTPQSADTAWAEFAENARWTFGRFVFATVHMVGSSNAADSFPGRTAADDAARTRRTAAAQAWLDAAFALAVRDSLAGVVLAFHGDPGLEGDSNVTPGYAGFLASLARHASAFPGQVLIIHGDSHLYRVDHPLRHPDTGAALANVTRLEVFGSPDIGWVRVVVDSAAGRLVAFEPRLMPRRPF